MTVFTDMDVVPPRDERDEVAEIAHLIEESSLGTPEARRLRDLAEPTTADRVVTRVYFTQTAEGAAWWKAHHRDPAALAQAAKILCRDGDDQEQDVAQRLLRLAAYARLAEEKPARTPPTARTASSAPTAPTIADAVPTESADDELPAIALERAVVQGPGQVSFCDVTTARWAYQLKTYTEAAGSVWDSFDAFYRVGQRLLDHALKPRLSAAEAARRRLSALTDAFDLWDDCLQNMPRPELWILGHAFSDETSTDNSRWLPRSAYWQSGDTISWSKMADTYLRGVLVFVVSENLFVDAPTHHVTSYLNKAWCASASVPLERGDDTIPGRWNGCDQEVRTFVELTALLTSGSQSGSRSTVDVLSTAFWRVGTSWDTSLRAGLDCKVVLSHRLLNQIRAFQRADQPDRLACAGPADVPRWGFARDIVRHARAAFLGAPGNARQSDGSVQEALQRLAPREREALVLRYHAGFESLRTAQVMGLAESVVQDHLDRARTKIWDWLVTPPTQGTWRASITLKPNTDRDRWPVRESTPLRPPEPEPPDISEAGNARGPHELRWRNKGYFAELECVLAQDTGVGEDTGVKNSTCGCRAPQHVAGSVVQTVIGQVKGILVQIWKGLNKGWRWIIDTRTRLYGCRSAPR